MAPRPHVVAPAIMLWLVSLLASNQGICTALSGLHTRRAFVTTSTNAIFLVPAMATAFDGTGSSAYSGRTPLEKASKAKSYRDRIVADVRDFNKLGASIAKSEVDGDAWVGFFIPYQRREPDAVGRTYAALLDLVGVEKSGGAALLLATPIPNPINLPTIFHSTKSMKLFSRILMPSRPLAKLGTLAKPKMNGPRQRLSWQIIWSLWSCPGIYRMQSTNSCSHENGHVINICILLVVALYTVASFTGQGFHE
jgi:hypothetical protein